MSRGKSAFALVELLVVVGIIQQYMHVHTFDRGKRIMSLRTICHNNRNPNLLPDRKGGD